MKKSTFICTILLMSGIAMFGQVAVNNDGSAPDNSAMLDIKSGTKGMLVPRMTAAQRNAIANPANGLLIFCTDNNAYYSNTGSPAVPEWIMVSSQWLTSGSDIFFTGGNVGVGTTIPDAPLTLANTSLGGTGTTGSFQIGQSNTYNLVCDNNEVQARFNGGSNTLFLQYWGGDLNVCSSGGSAKFYGPVVVNSNLNTTGKIGIKTTPSYDLHINSSDYSAAYISSPYDGGTVMNVVAAGTSPGTWGLYAYATTLGYAAYFSGNLYCTGSYLPSDESLKKNIQPMQNALENLMKLDIKTYYFKPEFTMLNFPSSRQYGFTAQNMERVYPELVKVNPAKGKEQPVEFKAVNYTGMIPVLTKAIQEQQAMIGDLMNQNAELLKRIEKLEDK